MHLSMSSPSGGVQVYTGYWQKIVAHARGCLDSFDMDYPKDLGFLTF